MADRRCTHQRNVTGVLNCDLSRNGEQKFLYSTQFKVNICIECGRAELYCDAHQDVCTWLASDLSTTDAESPRESESPHNGRG